MIAAGELNKRLILQQEAYNEGTLGKQNETWINVATVWGKITTNSASESVVAAQVQQVGKYTITIRYRRGVDSIQRVEYRGRPFQIHGVINVDEDDGLIVLDCSEWKGQR